LVFLVEIRPYLLKVDLVIQNAIDYFESLDDSILQNIALDYLKKHGVNGTREQSELFVKNSKKMIALVRQNTEINSEDMLKILVLALSEYAKKLSKDISQCDHLELDKIRKLRDEMNNAQAKIFSIQRSFSICR